AKANYKSVGSPLDEAGPCLHMRKMAADSLTPIGRPPVTGFNGSAGAVAGSARQAIDDGVDAELVGLVRVVDRPEAEARPLPELGDVGVVADEHLQAFPWIVVLEYPTEDRPAGVVRLRKHFE